MDGRLTVRIVVTLLTCFCVLEVNAKGLASFGFKNAVQSSSDGNHGAGNAIDGDIGTSALTRYNYEDVSWWSGEIRQTIWIDKIVLFFGAVEAGGYKKVNVSTRNSRSDEWKVCWSKSNVVIDSQREPYAYDVPCRTATPVNFVKISVSHGMWRGKPSRLYLRLAEVKVNGTAFHPITGVPQSTCGGDVKEDYVEFPTGRPPYYQNVTCVWNIQRTHTFFLRFTRFYGFNRNRNAFLRVGNKSFCCGRMLPGNQYKNGTTQIVFHSSRYYGEAFDIQIVRNDQCKESMFTCEKDKALFGRKLASLKTTSRKECSSKCCENTNCLGFDWFSVSKDCDLSLSVKSEHFPLRHWTNAWSCEKQKSKECWKYRRHTCGSGILLGFHKRKTIQDCKDICERDADCFSFEYRQWYSSKTVGMCRLLGVGGPSPKKRRYCDGMGLWDLYTRGCYRNLRKHNNHNDRSSHRGVRITMKWKHFWAVLGMVAFVVLVIVVAVAKLRQRHKNRKYRNVDPATPPPPYTLPQHEENKGVM